ncbi:hypothetical protein P170DRAFT_437569 [Aspergillus steynii IBT 23096]|uniref:Uncharacterized protein n=1 Tax=Aspergillus steynii IBT 23096 TaxID=1392250 RepID=A0A2I2G4M3_9EURO|nr:uncharacterized protein P170DRAFT_437569 [Aspergillus steynii IBT 23096]PLB47827.1 hypothetical protein P170DRAFT_437569 [Aspergillus steynii IBT 23096]
MSTTEPQPAEAPAPPITTSTNEAPNPQPRADEYTRSAKSGKFRFKSSRDREHRHRHRPRDRDRDRERPDHDRKHRHSQTHRDHAHDHKHSHSHSRSSKRHKHKHRPPSPSNPTTTPHPGLSADTAFRESLFDALGDDEGAAYWESVYGQPIHNFAVPSIPKGPDGELEQMDEEEYAAYVRTRMWERTREGMIEEQERVRAERARQRRREEKGARAERERDRFEREVEESLRRGQARRRVKAWKAVWEEYMRSWEVVDQAVSGAGEEGRGEEGNRLRNLLFWPVETGKRRDVSREAVEEFMRHAPSLGSSDAKGAGSELLATLKSERVRWHPDKIQHRYGSLGVDEVVMRSVTEVFQIVDTMWNELKGKQ